MVGDVTIGEESSIWFNTVARGDVNFIEIGIRTNVQDNSVLHVSGGKYPLIIGSYVTAGHRVILHGCTIKDYVLIGMGAIILDGAIIESESLVAAGCLVPPGFVVPSKTLVAGVPAKIKRKLTPNEIEDIKISAEKYVINSRKYMDKY